MLFRYHTIVRFTINAHFCRENFENCSTKIFSFFLSKMAGVSQKPLQACTYSSSVSHSVVKRETDDQVRGLMSANPLTISRISSLWLLQTLWWEFSVLKICFDDFLWIIILFCSCFIHFSSHWLGRRLLWSSKMI